MIKKKTTTDFISDITKAFSILSKRKKLYLITFEGINTPHSRDLNFILTNKFFNTINSEVRNSFEYINYLFVIEYGGIISKEKVYDNFISNLGLHAHCVVNTSLSKEQIEYYINVIFRKKPNYKIQDITRSNTKDDLLNYLLKQTKNRLLTCDCYNYKINEEKVSHFVENPFYFPE